MQAFQSTVKIFCYLEEQAMCQCWTGCGEAGILEINQLFIIFFSGEVHEVLNRCSV
jgi:hypothetical protein